MCAYKPWTQAIRWGTKTIRPSKTKLQFYIIIILFCIIMFFSVTMKVSVKMYVVKGLIRRGIFYYDRKGNEMLIHMPIHIIIKM